MQNKIEYNKITKTLFLQIFGHMAFIKEKVGWHSTIYMISIFHLQRLQRVAENLQKEWFCYFIISSTSLWRNHFNHIKIE